MDERLPNYHMPSSTTPPPPPHPGRKRRSIGFFGILAILVACAIVFGIGISVTKSIRGTGGAFSEGGVDEYPDLQSVWSYGDGDTDVVRIAIHGPIMRSEGGFFGSGYDPVESVLRQIRLASNDPEVKALIIEIDSPGGGITASDLIYNELQKFKAYDPERKIVAIFGDVAASGGYYVAVAADYIVAHPTTITGSIGVLISTINVKELASRHGVKDVTIKSGANKDMLNPFGDLSEQQHEILQGMISEMHGRFVTLVAEGRDLPREAVEKVADGRILTVTQALDSGLVDEVGYWDNAVDAVARLLDVPSVKIFRYQEAFSLTSLLMSVRDTSFSLDTLLHSRPRMMYLWRL
ncbi:MAG: signal peptide peptidase SppA [Verrucomicrobia bacterium]|nr:signal peptide peptidase SppA [Verrucomicrobiota bacterium]